MARNKYLKGAIAKGGARGMIDKNLLIEISQKDGSILKSHNIGGLKIDVNEKKKVVVISAEDIDKSIYYNLEALTTPNKFFLLIPLFFVLCYALVLWLLPNDYQMEKFLSSSILAIIGGFIYSHFHKNYTLMFSTLTIFILLSLFVCDIISFKLFLDGLAL